MICEPCAFEADMQKNASGVRAGDKNWHDDCNGCDCQHKDVKVGQIDGS